MPNDRNNSDRNNNFIYFYFVFCKKGENNNDTCRLIPAVSALIYSSRIKKINKYERIRDKNLTFVVFLVLARGAMRGASHLHITVDIWIWRNFGVKAHFLPALWRGNLRRRGVFAAVVRAEKTVNFEFAFRRDVPKISMEGSRSYSRAEPSAVLRVFQGLQHWISRRVCEPLPCDGTVQTSLHLYHLFSYPLHH